MELTAGQRRTLEQLIGIGSPPAFDPGLADRVRANLEARLVHAGIRRGGQAEAIWLGKHRLSDHQRCQGLFDAAMRREGPSFEHSARTAAGALFHKAIEIDIVTERAFDPATVCRRAARRLDEADRSFGRFWKGLDPLDRADVLADAGRHLFLFRDSFPPLPTRWAAQPELALRVHLAGGAVVLSGAPDLVVGRTRRLVLDFKTGRAWPDHPEDMRFYALLVLLRTGVPPYRVATFFLDSGEWQPEDVTEEMVDRAADRVAASAEAAHLMLQGKEPVLSPGVHCAWCPRRSSCPVAAGRFDGPRAGESSVLHDLLPNGRLTYRSDIPQAPTAGPARSGSLPQTEEGATARRRSDGAGRVRSGPDPPAGRGPPQDVCPGDQAGTLR